MHVTTAAYCLLMRAARRQWRCGWHACSVQAVYRFCCYLPLIELAAEHVTTPLLLNMSPSPCSMFPIHDPRCPPSTIRPLHTLQSDPVAAWVLSSGTHFHTNGQDGYAQSPRAAANVDGRAGKQLDANAEVTHVQPFTADKLARCAALLRKQGMESDFKIICIKTF